MNGDTVSIEVADGGWIMRTASRYHGESVYVYPDLVALMRAVANRVGFGHTLTIEERTNSGSAPAERSHGQ